MLLEACTVYTLLVTDFFPPSAPGSLFHFHLLSEPRTILMSLQLRFWKLTDLIIDDNELSLPIQLLGGNKSRYTG